MENVKQKFLQSHFLQSDHQDFCKDIQVSHATKRGFYWTRTLRTLYHDGLNIESD